MSLIIGTSGWYYDEWVGPFYKEKKRMLSHYTKVFTTTEVNSTFYRYPSPRMVQGWYDNAPPGFVYAVKLPKIITHDKWLNLRKGVEDDTNKFLELIQPLAEKLGPILIQLRPKFNYDEHAGILEEYLESVPGNYEWAVEFRHLSWMKPETFKILENHSVAYTIVDEPLIPPKIHITTDFAYIRWHGHGISPWYNYNYSPEELERWIPKVEEVRSKARRTYGYFNNHFSANAVKNAVEMLQMLESATPQQMDALDKIIEHKEKASHGSHIQPLEAFAGRDDGLSVADHLMRFTTTSRLSRAEKIEDTELNLKVNTGRRVEANIRNYTIEIDAEARLLKHDCDDWRKGKDQKRICKHIAKLFLSLPEGQAEDLLTEMWLNKESWQFLS